MSDSKVKEENENAKELFNFNGDEAQLKYLKEHFNNDIKNSQNAPNYFILILNHFSKCRLNQLHVSRELVECVYSSFPEQINEIQQFIKKTDLLKFITFPGEFPTKENKEQVELFLIIKNDDIDGFTSYFSNPTIDITKEQQLERFGYYFYLFDWSNSISLVDFCCLFGSLECFKHLLLNKCEITQNTLKWSIAGGNPTLVNILKENGYSFEAFLETSVKYHKDELTKWLNENYECKPFPLSRCIEYYNIDAFFYFLEHGHSINETDKYQNECLRSASVNGSLIVAQYLIEKGANIETKDATGQTPLYFAASEGHFPMVQYLVDKGANIETLTSREETPLHEACFECHLPIVKYLIEKGANIEAKDYYQRTPLHNACYYGSLPVVQYLIEKGADFEAKDKDQRTPLHFASQRARSHIVKYLISKGANKNPKDKVGKTPYDIACHDWGVDQSKIEIIRELLK